MACPCPCPHSLCPSTLESKANDWLVLLRPACPYHVAFSYIHTLPAQVVPIYSESEANDWLVRGYSRCDNYARRLDQWFGSDEFRAKERESEVVRWADISVS